jgi:hypothetical protein
MFLKRWTWLIVAVCLPWWGELAMPRAAVAQQPTIPAETLAPPLPDQEPLLAENAPVFDTPERSLFARVFVDAEWYASWGYSTQTWAPTNIHVSQPSLGNDFTLHNVRGHDEPGIGGFESQYNIRLGRFIDEARTLALEFNLDHTKYNSNLDQTVLATGTIAGAPVNTNMVLSANTFSYKLRNGANHVFFNLVKRLPLYRETNENWSIAGIGKLGGGFLLPHSSNTVLGVDNDVGPKTLNNAIGMRRGWWQLDGWTVGIEAGVRVVLFRPIYLEITGKYAYAGLSDIPVNQGTASHDLHLNEVIVSLGMTYDGISRRPR